ncbi:MAG: DedA family protein [Nanoarchaeota archaeon]|nr:DedA family protein [Nanoarchaeota archaeon]
MLQKFIDFLNVGGLPFLFLLVLLEGNPIVGSFIPGQVIVILVGFMISAFDFFSLTSVFIVVFLGAFLGDMLGYYFGKKYGIKGLKTFGVSKDSQIYISSKKFFDKFGFWSIILGREFNLTRSFMPFLAGVCKMKETTFIPVAIFSNLFWTILSLFLGYYFGAVVVNSLEFIFQFVTFLIIYWVILFIVYKSFKVFYHENYFFIKKYAIYNIIYLSFLFFFLFILLLLDYLNLKEIFNSIFAFCYLPYLTLNLGFIPSLNTMFGLVVVIFMFILLYPMAHRVRLLLLFLWGLVIGFLMTISFMSLILLWFKMKLFISVIFLTLLIFYLSILIRESVKKKKLVIILDILLVVFLLIIFLVKYALSGNFHLTLVSFLVGVIECELIIILSHYEIIDKYLSTSVSKNSIAKDLEREEEEKKKLEEEKKKKQAYKNKMHAFLRKAKRKSHNWIRFRKK